jgi:hypothetical protein
MRHIRAVNTIRRTIPVFVTLALVCTLVAAPAEAASKSVPTDFRQELQTFYQQLAAVGQQNPALEQRFRLVEQAKAGEQALSQLSDAQLAALSKVTSVIPNWQQLPAVIGKAAASQSTAVRHAAAPHATGDNCPAGAPGGIATVVAAQAAAVAADGLTVATNSAVEIVPDSEVFGAIVAGEGTVITSPASPLRIAAEVFNVAAETAHFVLEATAFSFEQVQAVHDACVEEEHVKALDDLTAQVASDVATIEGMLTKLSADLAADVAVINTKLDKAQTTLDTKIEQRQVHLDVIGVPNFKRFLISTTESGQPVNTTLVSLKAAQAQNNPITFTDVTSTVTATNLTPGVLQIDLRSPAPNLLVFQIEVKDDGSSGAVHYGTLLYTRHVTP